MKQLIQLLALALISCSSFAQTAIPNGDFENWANVGSSTEEPQYWHSNEDGAGWAPLGPETCFRDTSSLFGGTYCVKIESESYLGQTVNGSCTTGEVEAPTTNKADGYIESLSTNTGYITAFTGRPDSLVFWFRYTSVSGDYPTVQARLHVDSAYAPETSNSYHPTTNYNIISRALWQGAAASVSTWTRVSVPFVYVDGRTPQYIFITSTSSGDQTGGSSGSTLWLDEMIAIYNPTIATGSVITGPYFVNATYGTSITVPFTLTGTYNSGNMVTAQLSDINGSFASPVNLGSLSTTASGTINGTIPANTATGTGYKIRLVSSNPVVTSDTVANVSITLTATSVTPSATQNIAANTNGNTLTVTETPPGPGGRSWCSATTSGGPFTFIAGQSGTTYMPNFSTAGTYYVVCLSAYLGLVDTSNQVQINVVQNSIAPTSSQSILTNVNGDTLTVTETPAATSRVWAYATSAGGPYSPVVPGDVSTTYTPNFSSAGTYYVVCISLIDGVSDTSNYVLISVGSATIATGTINGSPFLFSPHAPDASVSVPYTTSGTFNGGNVFTAQLSDATGNFSNPTDIGNVTATTSGTINATISNATPSGTGYRIRVISSNPVVLGSDNGVDLVVNQFSNSVAPDSTQTLALNTNGEALAVTTSQTATQNWEYSTTSGSGYVSFASPQTATTYTPNFSLPGTYYVVCVSTNQYNDSVTSNEVQINVLNGDTIITLPVSGSPYNVSAKAHDTVYVSFTSTAVFNAGNVFTAQLSDNTGNFGTPVTIGALNGNTIGAITAVIPDNSVAGSAYRIRVISSNPAITGSDNGSNLTIIPFTISVTPADTQTFPLNSSGTLLTATSSQAVTSYFWQFSPDGIPGSFSNFSPAQTADTLLPSFTDTGLYYINCSIVNQVSDTITSQNIIAIVENATGIKSVTPGIAKVYWSDNDFVVDLTASGLQNPDMVLNDASGREVATAKLSSHMLNRLATHLPAGVYVFRISDSQNTYTGKAGKQ